MATPRKKPEDLLKVGRKTKYLPKYCKMLEIHMQRGYSFESFGSITNTSRETLYNWVEEHPEFLYSKTVGKSHSLYYHEQQLDKQITGESSGSTSSLIFAMKNKHADLYTDRKEIDHTGISMTISAADNNV